MKYTWWRFTVHFLFNLLPLPRSDMPGARYWLLVVVVHNNTCLPTAMCGRPCGYMLLLLLRFYAQLNKDRCERKDVSATTRYECMCVFLVARRRGAAVLPCRVPSLLNVYQLWASAYMHMYVCMCMPCRTNCRDAAM